MVAKDPSRGASIASSEASVIDPGIVAKILSKKDSIAGKARIKKPTPKLKVESNDENRRSGSPESPLMNEIDPDLRATFPTGRPMEDKADLIQCKHCKKPMLKAVFASHVQMCLQKKQDRAQRKKEQKEAARKAREAREKGKDEDGDVVIEDTVTVGSIGGGDGADDADGDKMAKIGKKSAVNGGGADKSKKRKADTEGDKEPKKKKTKKEIEAAKPKVPKPKGPVDVEKQCGVLLPNGAHCARSLTCKSHAMGAKRAVPGRSLPYDMLLAAYQKKNQAKQQKAAIDANAPLLDETDALGPVDSDEEMNQVMQGIARSRPQPIAQHIPVPTRQKYQMIRMKEMLRQALSGHRAGSHGGDNGGVYGGTPTPAGGSGLFMSGALGGYVGGAIGLPGGSTVAGGAVGDGPEVGEPRRATVALAVGGSGGRGSIGGGTTSSAAGSGMPARKASTTSQGPAAAS